MMPKQLFSPSTDGVDRNSFVNHTIDPTNVNVFERVWGLAKAGIQLLVLPGFEEVNLCVYGVGTDIHKGCVALASQIETVLSSSKKNCVLQSGKDEWMCV